MPFSISYVIDSTQSKNKVEKINSAIAHKTIVTILLLFMLYIMKQSRKKVNQTNNMLLCIKNKKGDE